MINPNQNKKEERKKGERKKERKIKIKAQKQNGQGQEGEGRPRHMLSCVPATLIQEDNNMHILQVIFFFVYFNHFQSFLLLSFCSQVIWGLRHQGYYCSSKHIHIPFIISLPVFICRMQILRT